MKLAKKDPAVAQRRRLMRLRKHIGRVKEGLLEEPDNRALHNKENRYVV